MKIGILTFHRAHNYGAVLQAYALSTYLKNQGYDAEIVDYRQSAIEKAHGTIPWGRLSRGSIYRRLRLLIHLIPYLPSRHKRAKVFEEFIDNLPTSAKIYTAADTRIEGYDYLICGSDQVWNPNITNGFDNFYTGNIDTSARWITYAASAEITPKQKNISSYKSILSRYTKISVRESIFKEQLEALTDKKITQVLDPIFLLSPGQWRQFGKKCPFANIDYVLVYQVKRDPQVLRYAHELAALHHCEVREITAEAEFKQTEERKVALSPQEFVGAFANAKMVVTTSFHGTAFSVMFGKPFATMKFNAPGDYRALDLLNTLGIDGCTITADSKAVDFNPKSVEATKLSEMLLISESYLALDE